MRRWPWFPALAGISLVLAATASAEPPAAEDAPPVFSGVLRGDAPIDPASLVLTVEGRTLYTADLDWHLYPGSVFEVEWLSEDHTAAAWAYRRSAEDPVYGEEDLEVRVEFRDRSGRRYLAEDPSEEDGVLLAGAGPILTISNALAFPNPFNPFLDDATVQFDLNMAADVEITAYDWAGEFVATVFQGAGVPSGTNDFVEWGGQTEDGRKLGNGVYLLRIVATTQARSESEVVKVVIWNEE